MSIISQNSNDVYYAYTRGRFWRWDESARVWKESHLLAQKFGKAKTAEKWLTPEAFLTSDEFIPMDDYELPDQMLAALRDAKPCKNAPIDPVEEPEVTNSPAVQKPKPLDAAPTPSAPSFDFGADEQTNALLLQDAQTFITGNMARIMAAKHAHDLTANHYKGSWGKWCAAVGISRDTGENMVRVAEQFGNIQIEGKSILDMRPLKLLYAAAKPSTPEQIKQAVFSGDITTNKQYQEALAQIKAEKDRAAAAEAREEEAWNMVSKSQDEAQTAKNDLDAALADVQGLDEENARLKAEKEKAERSYNEMYESRIAANLQRQKAEAERDRAEARAQEAENQLAGSRQVAEAAKLRGDKLKAENDALKKHPITTVVDKEEVERQAREMAVEMTADLRAQLEQAASGSEQDAHISYDNVLLADRSFQNIGKMVVPSLRRLPPEQREQLTNMLVHTLGQIQGEVSRCL